MLFKGAFNYNQMNAIKHYLNYAMVFLFEGIK